MQVRGLVHQLFEQQVDRMPERTAVRFEGQSVTYAELNRRANRLAYRLREIGVGPDVLVGVCFERSIELVVALLGVLKAGGAYVPLDPDYPKERLAYMMENSGVGLVVTQRQSAEIFEDWDGELVVLEELEYSPDDEALGNPNIALQDGHLALIIYTSGSTGRPKGAMITHTAIRDRIQWVQNTFGMGVNDNILLKAPYSFDVSIWEIFAPLACGAGLVVARPKGHLDSSYLWETIKSEHITMIQFVPTMLQTFLSSADAEDLPFLRHIISNGEPLPAALHARCSRMMSAQLHSLYGPTETTIFCTHWKSDLDPERTLIPIGFVFPEDTMYVLNERYEKVAPGEVGELFITGIGLSRGYCNRADLTAERFVPDPYSSVPGARMYHSGDLGRWLEDGSLECLGRIDDQVKVRGNRVELGEISTVLEQHADIRQAVSIVREDQPGDQRITAYYIPHSGSSPSVSELRCHLQRQLPEYMIPSYFVEMEVFPLTQSGKTDKKLLPSPVLSRSMIGHAFIAPETSIQKELALIWSGFFGMDQIGIDDDFIDLGGHSLIATQILVRCEHTLGVKVSLKHMLTEGTTIRSLASMIEAKLLAETDDAELEALLEEMEGMSAEELEALLK